MAQASFLAGTLAACRWLKKCPISSVQNVVADEAGQAYEAEMGSALNIAKGRFVLVGDHHQLGPRIRKGKLRDKNFDRSLVGRLVAGKNPTCLLDRNYRSHASIILFSSNEFYKGLQIVLKTSERAL